MYVTCGYVCDVWVCVTMYVGMYVLCGYVLLIAFCVIPEMKQEQERSG